MRAERAGLRACGSCLGASSPFNAHAGPVYGVRLAGDRLLTSSEDMTLGVWNLALGELTCRCEGHSLGILGAWLSTDALKAVSGGFDSVIRQWDLSTGSLKAECTRVMAGHSGPVVSIEASAHSILSTSFDGTLRLWDWSGRQVSAVEAHEGRSHPPHSHPGHRHSRPPHCTLSSFTIHRIEAHASQSCGSW